MYLFFNIFSVRVARTYDEENLFYFGHSTRSMFYSDLYSFVIQLYLRIRCFPHDVHGIPIYLHNVNLATYC